MSYLDTLFSLQGKTAVLIGGTGELCGAIAEGFAGAGASIILVGRNPDKAAKRLEKIHRDHHPRAWFEPCDVQSKSALEDLLARVELKAGGLDILVNGAGVNSPTPFLEVSEEEYQRIVDTNLKALFLSCQVFGRYFLEKNRPGSIINLGSMSGLTPLSRVFTYSATKAAVHNLSKNLAREWAAKSVRVNTLVPGFFPAEQNRKVLTPERVQQIMGHTPMKRFGEASELVGASLLLASDAGRFITGIDLVVDGGFNCMAI
jgi:NAD(P)-dependent dehydrogenase (short-subunit alcohol dehydrogenase family)